MTEYIIKYQKKGSLGGPLIDFSTKIEKEFINVTNSFQ